MVKYKVNLIFKENGKSLNEVITDVLKIELEKGINEINDNSKKEIAFGNIYYSSNGRNIN